MKNNRAKIGLLGLSLELYQKNLPELMESLKKFSHKLKLTLEETINIVHFPLACNREEIEKAFSIFKKENVEGIILVFLSYATSLSLLPVLKKYSFPLLIWNTQNLREITKEFSHLDLMNNHGMHGVQDLCSVLQREKIPFSLITGHFLDCEVQRRVKSWCQSAHLAANLKKIQIGRIGGTFKNMGDFSVGKEVLTKELGPKVEEIPFPYFAQVAKKVREEDINLSMLEDRKKFEIDKNLEEKTHFRSTRLELALREIVKEKGLSALAINFSAFDPSLGVETVPFLGISKLLGQGLGYGGEGDIYSATAVYLLQFLEGKANFVEMFTTDYKNSLILMNHMGESNPQMAKKDLPIRMVQDNLTLSNCSPTAILSFTLEPGEVTLLNLKISSKRKLGFILTRGEILDRPPFPDISSPHFIFKPRMKVEEFLTQYSLYGGTHHCALCYGDYSEEIRHFTQITGIPLLEI